MKIRDEEKINVLIHALDERYKSIHTIRERVQTVSIWILGILLGASGWLFQSNTCFSLYQKIFSVVLLSIVWVALRWFYFDDLQKGFNGQRQVAAKLEKSLGLFGEGIYADSNDSIYPKTWEKSGQKGSEGKFFANTYNLLIIGFGIFSLVILLLK
jgi:hypothetical protein